MEVIYELKGQVIHLQGGRFGTSPIWRWQHFAQRGPPCWDIKKGSHNGSEVDFGSLRRRIGVGILGEVPQVGSG